MLNQLPLTESSMSACGRTGRRVESSKKRYKINLPPHLNFSPEGRRKERKMECILLYRIKIEIVKFEITKYNGN